MTQTTITGNINDSKRFEQNGLLKPEVVKNGHVPSKNGFGKNGHKPKLMLSLENLDRPKNKLDLDAVDDVTSRKGPSWLNVLAMAVLLMANLINYMDRYTIAGVLLSVKSYYNINNAEAGLLQTSFIISYMIFSPIFGYLGDRYNRKLIMAGGIFFWSVITLAGSFVPKEYFKVFLLMRALVGVGEASYSTIAPTIIADLFVKDTRTKALSIFYFAIPVGSGLGYIVGSKVADLLGCWKWALRVTPGLGVLCAILIVLVVKEPNRGEAEGSTHLVSTTWGNDIIYLCKNKSFMLSSAGFTCVAFVAGALAFWAPPYMDYSIRSQGVLWPDSKVAFIFGVITCGAGFLGVGMGSECARRMRKIKKISDMADPFVCAFGLIVCSPFLYFVLVLSKQFVALTWVLIFIGETLLCLNWAIVTDILLYIVIPTRRSTAEAFQILMSHALGDAGSPYIIGIIADSLNTDPTSIGSNYISLQYALYITCFVSVLGGGFFLFVAIYIRQDRAKADKLIKGSRSLSSEEPELDEERGLNRPCDSSEDSEKFTNVVT